MPTPCVNAIRLGQHLDKLDAEAADAEFIESYCIKHMNEKMIELALDSAEWDECVVADAVLNDHDHVDTYFMQALREYQRNEKEAFNDALSIAYTNLGRAVFMAAKAMLEKTANEYLEQDAEAALEREKERANCSCHRTGRECVC